MIATKKGCVDITKLAEGKEVFKNYTVCATLYIMLSSFQIYTV